MKIEIYRDKQKKWRWRLKARNGKVIADSGQGYTRRDNMLETLKNIQNNIGRSPITYVYRHRWKIWR